MNKRTMKKGLAIVLALVMVFAMTATAFANTSGTVNVKFYVPEKYADLGETYHNLAHDGYTYYGQRADAVTSANVNVYELAGTVNLANMTAPAVTLPQGFQGLYNTGGNVFDVIYNFAVTQKGQTATEYPTTTGDFVYGFDTPSYTETGVRADGIFINKLSGNGTNTLATDNTSFWWGYNWSLYAVPSSAAASFNPLNPDETYKSKLYTNNVNAVDGYTYYMIYEYNEESWG